MCCVLYLNCHALTALASPEDDTEDAGDVSEDKILFEPFSDALAEVSQAILGSKKPKKGALGVVSAVLAVSLALSSPTSILVYAG